MQNNSMQGSGPGTTSNDRYGENVAEKARESYSRLSDSAHQTLDRVSDAATQAASKLSARGHELWDHRGEAVETARSYVREHPLATIGIAVAIGLIISRLTSRR